MGGKCCGGIDHSRRRYAPPQDKAEPNKVGWVERSETHHGRIDCRGGYSLTLNRSYVLDWFRAQGKIYQTKINAILRWYYEAAYKVRHVAL